MVSMEHRGDFGFESIAFLHLVSELLVLLLGVECRPIDALIFGPTVDGVFVYDPKAEERTVTTIQAMPCTTSH